jgi:two-component system, cell cycle response regulator
MEWDLMSPAGLESWRSVTGPALFAGTAIALLVYNHLQQRFSDLVFWLGLALIASVVAWMLQTSRRQSGAIASHQRGALSDQVTGLHSRLWLEADLAAVMAVPGDRRVLGLLELDGFQTYNDSFGDRLGDELLRRVAQHLTDAVAPLGGIAYRIDTSRFAVLVPAGEQQLREVLISATASMGEDNRDLLVGRSYGEVTIPDEAVGSETAFQIAGRRLASHKQRQHNSARRQAHAVLVAVLSARRPELRDHLRVVAYRAISLGRRLGVDRDMLDDIMIAAELQDIGMLSVPESILEKPPPLSEAEIESIRGHPLAGERILSAASGLAPVASLVRASYERFDGSGYPDGLAGDAIPLGARIIAVAVAFAAMTSPRPYREAGNVEQALAELRRCAGTQFDPRVVEALAGDLAEEASQPSVPPPANREGAPEPVSS